MNQAWQCLATSQAFQPDGAETQQAQAWVETSDAEVKRWQDVRSTYRNYLANLSLIMHPWRLLGSTPQTSQEVERQLQAEIAALEMLVETNGVPGAKQ